MSVIKSRNGWEGRWERKEEEEREREREREERDFMRKFGYGGGRAENRDRYTCTQRDRIISHFSYL